MKKNFIDSLKILFVMTVLTGILYPVLITLLAQVIFPALANGSFVKMGHRIVGSELIGQQFQSDRYFWSRPSAIDYNPIPSGGSNLGPTSDSLKQLVEKRRIDFVQMNKLPPGTNVPDEMLHASASGIDPHISPLAARLQADRVVRARGLDSAATKKLLALIEHSIQAPELGFLGEPRVNVLKLNIALDTVR